MSKKDLKIYLNELSKDQLEDQILDLYTRFKSVKTYYNFVFNPKEDKLSDEAKFKISKEYFPLNDRKPKARRSVAQKIIRHFIQLGVDTPIIIDIMLYNIEVALQYSQERNIKQESFYKSIFKSFEEAINFIKERKLQKEFESRVFKIVEAVNAQNWINKWAFGDCFNR